LAARARIASFGEFWPHYLREHAKPATRSLHYLGTALGLAGIGGLIATGNPWFFAGAVATGYAPAWLGHVLVEKNKPATLRYPFWSLISDFRMFAAWLTGGLGDELAKAGVAGQGARGRG